jgi:hypothetical protein
LPLQFVWKCNVVLCHDSCTLFQVCSLQAKLHLCPRKQTPTPGFMTSVSWTSLDAENHRVFIPWIVLWSLESHSYETVKKIPHDPAKICPKWLVNKHSITLLINIETFGNPFGWQLSHG